MKITRLYSYMAVLLALLYAGCATFAAPKNYSVGKDSTSGMVIVSFSQPYPVMKWMYRDLSKWKGLRGFNENFLTTTSIFGNGIIINGDSVIYPMVLPQGEYEFYRWTEPEAGTYHHSVKDFSIRFKSVPGKVIYAGNIYVPTQKNTFSLIIRDNRSSDLEVVKSKYQNLNDDDFEVQLMTFSPQN